MNSLEKIVANKRLPVLFIGSGISRRYLQGYPSWEELLKKYCKKISGDDYLYNGLMNQYEKDELSNFKKYERIASYIQNEFDRMFFAKKIKVGNSQSPKWMSQNISPFKMDIDLSFKKKQLTTNAKLLKEIDEFKNLKNKIAAVLTTNYDNFIEEDIFSNDYSVFTNQSELFSNRSYNYSEIYKIHGSCLDAKSIIITEKDYNDFNTSRRLIIAKMLTLFAEAPIIFIGYSLTDENIKNLILDFLDCLSTKQLINIHEHFIFISYKAGENKLIEYKSQIITEKGKQIPFTCIETDNYLRIYEILNKLVPGMRADQIRKTKRLVKNLVDHAVVSGNVETTIVGIDALENIGSDINNIAIAIGYKQSIIARYGYIQLPYKDLVDYVLLNENILDPNLICSHTFESINKTRLIPVYKFIKDASSNTTISIKLKEYIELHNTESSILSKNIKKSHKNLPIYTSYEQLKEAIEKEEVIRKKCGLLLQSASNFNINVIHQLLSDIYVKDKEVVCKDTTFKHCLMYVDYKENYENSQRTNF